MPATDLHVKWGQRLRRLRRERELSVVEVANAVGIDRSTLYRIERGHVATDDDTRIKLAAVIGVPAADIFDYDDALESAS